MKTITNCVEEILLARPFLEEALTQKILNFSALAEVLQDPISNMLHKPVKAGAIMMALRRYKPPMTMHQSAKMKQVIKNLGDITLRSNLVHFTVKNSDTLIVNHSKILDKIKNNNNSFYTFTRGIHESNIIVSNDLKAFTERQLEDENCLVIQDSLSAITLNLPESNSRIAGLYYHFFKRLAWDGVVLYEVISTTNEFTILVEDSYVDKAFQAIKKMKNA